MFHRFTFVEADDDTLIKCLADQCTSPELSIHSEDFNQFYTCMGYAASNGYPDQSDVLLECKMCGKDELATNISGEYIYRGIYSI